MEILSTIAAQRGVLDLVEAVGWALRLAERVELMHADGKVHGSISALAISVTGASTRSTGRLADPGRALEVAAYRSPERAAAAPGSVADDVWATVVTLYLLLTGVLPFPGDTYDEVQWKCLAAPPTRLREHGIDDAELQRIVDRAFSIDLASRTVTMRALREQLEAWGSRNDLLTPAPLDPDDGSPLEADDEKTAVRTDVAALVRKAVAAARDKPPDLGGGDTPHPGLGGDTPDPGSAPEPEPPPSRPPPSSRPAPSPSEAPPSSRSSASSRPAPSSRHPPPSRSAPFFGNIMAMAARNAPPVPRPSAVPAPLRAEDAAPAASPAAGSVGKPRTPGVAVPPPPMPATAHSPPGAPPAPAPEPAHDSMGHEVSEIAALQIPPAMKATRVLRVAILLALGALGAVVVGWLLLRGNPDGAGATTARLGLAPWARAIPPATSSPATVPSPDACMRGLFAEDTFETEVPALASICTETDPRRGGATLKSLVVRAGSKRGLSSGMKEWAMMGWYDMAAFAALRGRCCPSPPPLTLPSIPAPCDPVADVLNELGAAAAASDEAKTNTAVERYTTTVRCVARGGGGSFFGRGPPGGGEATTFAKTLARLQPPR